MLHRSEIIINSKEKMLQDGEKIPIQTHLDLNLMKLIHYDENLFSCEQELQILLSEFIDFYLFLGRDSIPLETFQVRASRLYLEKNKIFHQLKSLFQINNTDPSLKLLG